jgi:hypothetical protein
VETGGEAEENDGMMYVVEDRKRWARWYDIWKEDREEKSVERGGYAVGLGMQMQ